MPFPTTTDELSKLQQEIQGLAKEIDQVITCAQTKFYDNFFYARIPTLLNKYFDIPDDNLPSLNSITIDYFQAKLNGKSNVRGVTAQNLFGLFDTVKKIYARFKDLMPQEMKAQAKESVSSVSSAVSNNTQKNHAETHKSTVEESEEHAFLLAASLSRAFKEGTPLNRALKANYQTYCTLENTLLDNRQPISQINLSIIETRLEERAPSFGADSPAKDVNQMEENKVLSYYEQEYNIRELIEVDDIFEARKGDIGIPTRILILGRAGIGKTTMSQYFAYQWSQGKLWKYRFDYVFWIPLRKLGGEFYQKKNTLNLIEIIKRECISNMLVNSIKNEDIDQILKKNLKRTLFVLDGYDEIAHHVNKEDSPLQNLMRSFFEKQGPLAGASIILTSRPHHLPSAYHFNRQLENMGFNDANIKSYVEGYFALLKRKSDAPKFLDFLKSSPSVWGVAHIPLNLALICEVILREQAKKQGDQLFLVDTNLTQLYQKIISYLFIKYLKNKKIDTDNQSVDWLYKQLVPEIAYIELLAFNGFASSVNNGTPNLIPSLQKEVLAIVEDEYKPPESNKQMSLFNRVLGLDFLKTVCDVGHESTHINALEKEHYFIHFTFQEFFAARYLAQSLQQDCDTIRYQKALDFIKNKKYHPSYQIMFGFIAGLLRSLSKEFSPAEVAFWDTLLKSPFDISGVGHLRLIVRCLEEANCDPQIPSRNMLLAQIAQWGKALVIKGDSLLLFKQNDSEWFYSILERNVQVIKQSKIVDDLVELLDSTNQYIAAAAARALRQLKQVNSEVIYKLLLILRLNRSYDGGRFFIRSYFKPIIADMLTQFGHVDNNVILILIEALSDKDFSIMMIVIQGLLQLKKIKDINFNDDDNENKIFPFKKFIMIELVKLVEANNKVDKMLMEIYQDVDSGVVKQATERILKDAKKNHNKNIQFELEPYLYEAFQLDKGLTSNLQSTEEIDLNRIAASFGVALIRERKEMVNLLGVLGQSPRGMAAALLAMFGIVEYVSNSSAVSNPMSSITESARENGGSPVMENRMENIIKFSNERWRSTFAGQTSAVQNNSLPTLFTTYFNRKYVKNIAPQIALLALNKHFSVILTEKEIYLNDWQTLTFFSVKQNEFLVQILLDAFARVFKERGLPNFYLLHSFLLSFQNFEQKGAYDFSTQLADQAVKIHFHCDHVDYKNFPRAIRDQAYSLISESCIYLDLSGNQLDDKAVQLFIPILARCKLHTLVLSHNKITEIGLEYLLYTLAKSPSVKFLILDHNYITFDSDFCQNKLEPLAKEAGFEKLDLSMNFIYKGEMLEEKLGDQSRKIVYDKETVKKKLSNNENARLYCKFFFAHSRIMKSFCSSSVKSIVDPENEIDKSRGIVALYAYKTTLPPFGEHAFLMLEGVHKFGQRFLIMGDLFLVNKQIKILISHCTPTDYLKRIDYGKRTFQRSACLPKADISKVREAMLASRDRQAFFDYKIFPGDSQGAYNCLKWAVKMLEEAGIRKDFSTWIPSRAFNASSCLVM